MKKTGNITSAIVLFSLLLSSCKANESTVEQGTKVNQGTIMLVANGENLVRQGFLAKDGWQIEFDRLEVTVSQVIAYEVNSDYDRDVKQNLKSQPQVVILAQPTTIDLKDSFLEKSC